MCVFIYNSNWNDWNIYVFIKTENWVIVISQLKAKMNLFLVNLTKWIESHKLRFNHQLCLLKGHIKIWCLLFISLWQRFSKSCPEISGIILLEMQILGLHGRSTKSKTQGGAYSSLRTTVLGKSSCKQILFENKALCRCVCAHVHLRACVLSHLAVSESSQSYGL